MRKGQFECYFFRKFTQYDITVENPEHVSKGVCQIFLDGALTEKIPVQEAGSTHKVRIVMGSTQDEKEEAK